MSAFEFFFSFYGLLLGLSVAEVVGGFARVLHERQRVRFGWLTPLLAVFVALDVATFWQQAWGIFRGAPFDVSLLVVGLVVASTFYVAASVTFPRLSSEATGRIDLDEHFWAHRRLILSCILAANTVVALLFILLITLDAGFAARSSASLWIGVVFFDLATATAAFASNRKIAVAALISVLTYTVWKIGGSAVALIAAGGWSPPGAV